MLVKTLVAMRSMRGVVTTSRLARQMKVSEPMVVAMLCELERRGYVSNTGQRCSPNGACGPAPTANRCADCGMATGTGWTLTSRGLAMGGGAASG